MPSAKQEVKKLVSSESIKDCKVKVNHVTNALVIVGLNLDRLGVGNYIETNQDGS